MNKKVRTALIICLNISFLIGVIVLLVAAIGNRNEQICNGFEIRFKGNDKEWFMDKKDIVGLLEKSGYTKIKGTPIVEFDLFKIEKKIQQNAWVKNVDLHFDNNQILQIYIEEEQPVVRIFDTEGKSFYFSSNGKKLPLSTRITAKVPVLTGFPIFENGNQKKQDQLIKKILELSSFIQDDPFWKAQIAQMHLMSDGKINLYPTIGKQTIQFGTISAVPEKFRKLELFYEQVLTKVGIEKYKTIDLQYDRQIVARAKD